MRNLSLSVRILLLALLLVAVAAFCVTTLVFAGALHPRAVHVAGAGGAILLVAALAATVSALGPKYRPTPFLTPLTAGVFVAVLATTALYATQRYTAPKPAKPVVAAAHVAQPKSIVAHPVKTAPVVDTAAIEPEMPAEPTSVSRNVSFDPDTFAPAPQLPLAASPPADATPAAIGNSTVSQRGPMEAAAEAIIPSAHAAEPPADKIMAPVTTASAMPAAPKKPAAVASIPVPVAAPADVADLPANLQVNFDPSGPTARKPGAPLKLAVAAATPVKPAIPPLPRIRPCGADGPACP